MPETDATTVGDYDEAVAARRSSRRRRGAMAAEPMASFEGAMELCFRGRGVRSGGSPITMTWQILGIVFNVLLWPDMFLGKFFSIAPNISFREEFFGNS